MNRRLFFVLPDVTIAHRIKQGLLLAKVEERRMHFLARRGTDLTGLPEAGTTQKTDLLHGSFIGFIGGGITGTAIGFCLYLFPQISGADIRQIIILVCALLFAALGAWIGGLLIGSSTPNIHLAGYQESMQEGHILLMLDVAANRVEEIRALIKARYPEAEDHGFEPGMPAFP